MEDFSKEYSLKLGNINYIIYLKKAANGEKNSIIIEAKNNKSYYQGIFTLNDLMMLNKTFRFCDNINEALNIIIKIFESYNKTFLKKSNSNDEIFLFLRINLPSGEEQEIKLTLYKIETTELSNEELLTKINQLEEENKNFKEEITKLKIENNKKDKMIESLSKNQVNSNINNNYDNYIEDNNDIVDEIDQNSINTDIIYT